MKASANTKSAATISRYQSTPPNPLLDDGVGAAAATLKGVGFGRMVVGEWLSPKLSFKQNSSLTFSDVSLADTSVASPALTLSASA